MSAPSTTPATDSAARAVSVEGGLGAAFARTHQCMDELAARVKGETDHEALALAAVEVTRLQARSDELAMRVAAAAEAAKVAEPCAATGTDAWFARLAGTRRSIPAGMLWLAELLESYPTVGDAFGAGDITREQATIITRAVEKVPESVDQTTRDELLTDLVARTIAERPAPKRLRGWARRMCDKISPALGDQQEHDIVKTEENRAARETWMILESNGDGYTYGRFCIPDLQAQMLITVLQHLSSPRRVARNKRGQTITDPTSLNFGPAELLGIAFAELIEHLPTDGYANHGRVGATIMVHLPYKNLLTGLGAAHLDSGSDITPAQARRLACNAGILPAIFDTPSVLLNLGRTARLHTPPQRAALSARYDTCAAAGCERPFAWCEIHHPHSWTDGGGTDLTNALPLCSWHHHRAHDPAYHHELTPDGEIEYTWQRRRLPPAVPETTSSTEVPARPLPRPA